CTNPSAPVFSLLSLHDALPIYILLIKSARWLAESNGPSRLVFLIDAHRRLVSGFRHDGLVAVRRYHSKSAILWFPNFRGCAVVRFVRASCLLHGFLYSLLLALMLVSCFAVPKFDSTSPFCSFP